VPFGPFLCDPKCYYDPDTGRWLASFLEIAIDPKTGEFGNSANQYIAASEFYVSTNEASINGPAYNGAHVYAMSKTGLETGANTTIAVWNLTNTASLKGSHPALALRAVVLPSEEYTQPPRIHLPCRSSTGDGAARALQAGRCPARPSGVVRCPWGKPERPAVDVLDGERALSPGISLEPRKDVGLIVGLHDEHRAVLV
jgi:hypothetical protein